MSLEEQALCERFRKWEDPKEIVRRLEYLIEGDAASAPLVSFSFKDPFKGFAVAYVFYNNVEVLLLSTGWQGNMHVPGVSSENLEKSFDRMHEMCLEHHVYRCRICDSGCH